MTTKAYSIIRGASSSATPFPPIDLTTTYDFDDFIFGSDTMGNAITADLSNNGSIGNGWEQTNSSGDKAWTEFGFPDTEAEQIEHPGLLYLVASDDTAATFVTIQRPSGAAGSTSPVASPDKTFHWRAVVNAYQIQSGVGSANVSMQQMFGLAVGGIGFDGDGGLGFGYTRAFNEPSSPFNPPTHWHVVHGSVYTEADVEHTSVEVDTNYHLFEILHTGGTTSYTFKIDGATVATITFDYATYFSSKTMRSFFSLYETSSGTGGKVMAIDFYDLLVSGLTRYTPA